MKNGLKRIACSAFLAVCSAMSAFAGKGDASKINEGLQSATTTVTGMFDYVVDLLYAVCAIMACIGVFHVYSKWSSGDPDVTKAAAGWIGSLVFIIVAIIIIEKVFI